MNKLFENTVELSNEIARFIAEDVGSGDLTALIIPELQQATASVITREDMTLCGRAWFEAVFLYLDRQTVIDWEAQEGCKVKAGETLCRLSGNARALLTGERAALNLLQTLSATATLAQRYAQAVAGFNVKVLDTRKTLPGLRQAQKYAVRCGGCHNHRSGLYDGILIKENHILAAGSIALALEKARALNSGVPIEIEVETLDELDQALAANAERVLLDNFSLEQLGVAVARNAGRAKLEVSGNVGLDNIRSIAETGVDFISIGALTKNVQAIDLSMRIVLG
jgi:nicotinate-nucleotide pyrophosphorylase (carboxylating)